MGKRQNRTSVSQAELAPEQYPELNATLYDSDPATYLRYRLHTLVTMFNEQERPAAEVTYGELSMPRPDEFSSAERARAIALESTMLVHHAGESLMRLYLAHVDEPRCPWLTVAKLTFPKVKPQVARFAKPDFVWPENELERVFLGGSTPEEAGLDVAEEQWSESVAALRVLMRLTAQRITSQAPLYNAAKHGLVGIPGDGFKLSMTAPDGLELSVSNGPTVTYLRNPEGPVGKWSAQTDVVDIETDFASVYVMTVALHNLWAVARRRYLAKPGQLYLIPRQYVGRAFFLGALGRGNLATGMSVQLHEKVSRDAPWGRGLGPGILKLNMVNPVAVVSDDPVVQEQYVTLTPTELPLRECDVSPFTGNSKYLFPFSPRWASPF